MKIDKGKYEDVVEKLSLKYRTAMVQLVALMNAYLKEELVPDEKYQDIPAHLEKRLKELVEKAEDTLKYLRILDKEKKIDNMQEIFTHRLQYCYKQLFIGIIMDKLPYPKNVTDIFLFVHRSGTVIFRKEKMNKKNYSSFPFAVVM